MWCMILSFSTKFFDSPFKSQDTVYVSLFPNMSYNLILVQEETLYDDDSQTINIHSRFSSGPSYSC